MLCYKWVNLYRNVSFRTNNRCTSYLESIREPSVIIYRPDAIFWRPAIVLHYDVITSPSDVINPIFLHHIVSIKLLYKCTKFHGLSITGLIVTGRGHFVPPRCYTSQKSPVLIGLSILQVYFIYTSISRSTDEVYFHCTFHLEV